MKVCWILSLLRCTWHSVFAMMSSRSNCVEPSAGLVVIQDQIADLTFWGRKGAARGESNTPEVACLSFATWAGALLVCLDGTQSSCQSGRSSSIFVKCGPSRHMSTQLVSFLRSTTRFGGDLFPQDWGDWPKVYEEEEEEDESGSLAPNWLERALGPRLRIFRNSRVRKADSHRNWPVVGASWTRAMALF